MIVHVRNRARQSKGNWGDAIQRTWLALIAIMTAIMNVAIASASENDTSSPAVPTLTEIPAEYIKASAYDNTIAYDHIKVIGDLQLDQSDYNSLKITNSIILGNISASNATFNSDVDFTNTIFCKKATFFNSDFEGQVDFSNSLFYGDANFSQSRFLEGATFDYNTFERNADFSASVFQKFGSFYNSTFKGNATFDYSTFTEEYINFESARFLENADFADCHFNTFFSCLQAKFFKDVDFEGSAFGFGSNFSKVVFIGVSKFEKCQFNKDTKFTDDFFNNTTYFSSATFDGPSFFSNAKFHGNAIFNSVLFMAPSDFSEVRFDKDLAMNSTEINTMVFDNVTFNERSHLFLAKADINRFMVKWETVKDILSYDSSSYLSLVKNYRDLGLDEADDCYYQYRFLSQESKNWSWSKVYDIMAEVTCGYGVRPDRPITSSIILVIICALIFFLGRGLKGHENTNKKELFLDSLYYSLATFLEVHSEVKPRGRYRYVSIFLKSLSWLLFALLVGTITKVMIG